MNEESCLPKPRSPFGQVPVDFPCPEMAGGTLHLVPPPLVQLIPSVARWWGQIVIDLMLSSVLSNNAARERMRSISFSGPEKLSDDKCFDIFFVQDSKGIIWVWRFRSLTSKPQELPTIDLNVQHASMFTTSAFSICMCYLSLRITHFSTAGSRLILGMGRVGRAILWMVVTKWIQLNTDKLLQYCWCNFVFIKTNNGTWL